MTLHWADPANPGNPLTTYGWALVTFEDNDGVGTLHSWAYEDTGAAIKVGAIPEPRAAILLLLGLAGLAHRRLALESVHVDDEGNVRLRDFDSSETAATERELARDVAQLLAETAVVIGAQPAVAEAVAVMGSHRIAPALRMLQPLALPPATRSRAAQVPDLLDALRSAVATATGEPELELEEESSAMAALVVKVVKDMKKAEQAKPGLLLLMISWSYFLF